MKRSCMRGVLAAAALTLAATVGGGCVITARPAGTGIYYASHGHMHDEWCGHYRTWHDGYWVYYYNGRWEYYHPHHRSWVYYEGSHVPGALHGHVGAARVYKAPGRSGTVGKGHAGPSGTVYKGDTGKGGGGGGGAVVVKPAGGGGATVGKGGGSPGYGATKAPPKDKDKDKGKGK